VGEAAEDGEEAEEAVEGEGVVPTIADLTITIETAPVARTEPLVCQT